MRVETLSTAHFRNLTAGDVAFSPGTNVLVGENGQGKTNLLEAISFFKFGRSFRARRDAELIRFGEPFCRAEVSCVYNTGNREQFTATIERGGQKKIKIGNEPVIKLSELAGEYPVVLFGPQDLRLVTGAPAERRRFIDMVGSMTDRSYIELLRAYRRTLDQRNAALRWRATKAEREAWNAELIETGCELIARRRAVVEALERRLEDNAQEFGAPYEFSMEYVSAVNETQKGESMKNEMRAAFERLLASLENEELRRGTTLAGPHRDDVEIKLGGKNLKRYGSQGQKRLFAVLIRLSELAHLESELGEPCVLLLDDVFSEFDKRITRKLQNLVDGSRQAFVTSPCTLEWEKTAGTRVFHVSGGTATA